MDMTIGFFFWSMIIALLACLILVSDKTPSLEQMSSVLHWLVPFTAIAVIPGAFASLWGPKFLSPGLAGLLMMTEIIFGSITAALFANEAFGTREIIGIVLISFASLVEPLYEMTKKRSEVQKINC